MLRATAIGPTATTTRCRTSGGALVAALVLVTLVACSGQPTDAAGETPEQTFDRYRALLGAQALGAETRLLTVESRQLFAARPPSASAQSAELRAIRGASATPRTLVSDARAVILFVGDDSVSPYFFHRGADGWEVDLAAMAKYIAFDGQNRWRLRSTTHPYGFAFQPD